MTESPWRRRFRAPRVTLPRWARDEPARCAYLSNLSGRWEVHTWDRRRDVHRRATDRPEGTWLYELDPRGERLLWFDDDHGDEFGRWMTQPFDGGPASPLHDDLRAAYPGGLAVGTSAVVVGSADDDGHRIELVRDGRLHELYRHREEAFVGELSRDERLVCIAHAEHGDSRHPALRVVGTDGATVGDLWDGPGLGLWPGSWSPVPGDARLLVTHERRDLPRPLVWDPTSGDCLELSFELEGEVSAEWYPDGRAVLVVHEQRGRSELYRFDLPDGPLVHLPTEPGTIAEAAVRPDGEVWYRWTSAATPPEVRAGGTVLLRPPGEPAPSGVPFSSHTVEGVHCFVAEPPGPRPHPVVFDVHGGPHACDLDAFDPHVQAWVDHGFAVVLVNYRGSTGFGRAWRDAIEGNPGFTELDDIAKVHDWVVAEGLADPARCVLAGGSWGGYLTLLGLGTQANRWSLGIADVPVADYVAAYEDEMEPLKAFDRALFGGSPEDRPDTYARRSPISYAHLVEVPVLVLVGENDPRCPVRQIDNYLARLRDLGKAHEVYRYDAGHGSRVVDESIRQMEARIDFAARHLGTSPPR